MKSIIYHVFYYIIAMCTKDTVELASKAVEFEGMNRISLPLISGGVELYE